MKCTSILSAHVFRVECNNTNNYLATRFAVLDSPSACPLSMEIANGKGN